MRFSTLASGIVAVSLAASAMPAAAQEWASSPTPFQGNNGTRACFLFSGEALPIVGVQVYADRAQLMLKAAALRGISTGHHATLAFPSGATVPVALFKTSVDSDLALVPMPRNAGAQAVDLDTVIDHFRATGTFSVSSDRLHIEVGPLPDATVQIASLEACLRELDNG
jgi:hypothetical protein